MENIDQEPLVLSNTQASADSQLRKKRCLKVFDYLIFSFFILTLVLICVLQDKQSFMLLYIYIQYLAFYLTFRIRHTPLENLNFFFKIHIFNFLYSLFTLVTGYIEIYRGLFYHQGVIEYKKTIFICEFISLIMSHIVIGVYLCCRKVSMGEPLQQSQRPSFSSLIYGEQQEQRKQTFEDLVLEEVIISKDEIEEDTLSINSNERINLMTCSICLEDFADQEIVKCLPQCRHRFHQNCLRAWYNSNPQVAKCPMCRQIFSQQIINNQNNDAQQALNVSINGRRDDYQQQQIQHRPQSSARQNQQRSSRRRRRQSFQPIVVGRLFIF